jgi:imidazoleglycerol-phosphate dehydratase
LVIERSARQRRVTEETEVEVELRLDGGPTDVDTGVAFFDHMLDQLGRHGRVGLSVHAKGDLEVDAHHTVEDVGLVLGSALREALGDKHGIRRYGDALVPMEEALAQVALDISGRSLLVYEADLSLVAIGRYDAALTREFLQALCRGAGLTVHVRLLTGSDPHHCTEAIFKSFARALGDAVALDPRAPDVLPSTKGVL